MIEKECAREIQVHALSAVMELSNILNLSKGRCSSERYEHLRESVGRAVAGIQMEILEAVIAEFPELDNLK